jgi:hypothetical protein
MATLVHQVVVVLKLPLAIAALIVRATAIVDAVAANSGTFVTPSPALALLRTHIATLTTAESATKTHTAGTVAARDAAKKVLLADLRQLRAYVEALATASPDQAAAIAEQAAMTLKKQPATHKSDLALKQTVSGTVQVVAKATAGSHAHEWQYSTDGGKTWIVLPSTLKASTAITGLTPGVSVQVRHRPVTKEAPGDWSQPVSALVT